MDFATMAVSTETTKTESAILVSCSVFNADVFSVSNYYVKGKK